MLRGTRRVIVQRTSSPRLLVHTCRVERHRNISLLCAPPRASPGTSFERVRMVSGSVEWSRREPSAVIHQPRRERGCEYNPGLLLASAESPSAETRERGRFGPSVSPVLWPNKNRGGQLGWTGRACSPAPLSVATSAVAAAAAPYLSGSSGTVATLAVSVRQAPAA